MSAKKHGLGRGFSSLIPDDLLDEAFDPTASEDEKISDLKEINLNEIQPDPNQPRKNFDPEGLEELALSIKQHGVLQPIVVTPKSNNYIIVAGERRFRAAKIAGLDKMPAIVRTLDSQNILELSLIENLQRKDLNPLETATAFIKLRDQFNLTMDQIAERMGAKSVSAISNKIRLLKLPKEVQKMVADRKLKEGQVRPLIGLNPDLAVEITEKIIKEGWSARKIEQFIVDIKSQGPEKQITKTSEIKHSYEDQIKAFSSALDTKVKIRSNSKGAGKLTIEFKNEEDLKRIQNIITKSV